MEKLLTKFQNALQLIKNQQNIIFQDEKLIQQHKYQRYGIKLNHSDRFYIL